MGININNYIIMKSNKVDLDSLLKEYLEGILSIDERDLEYLMVYNGGLEKDDVFKSLDKSKFKDVVDRKYYRDGDFLLFYSQTCKCDLVDSFEDFIAPNLSNLEVCKIFNVDEECSDEIYEKDYLEGKATWFYEEDLPDYFFNEDNGVADFILSRCGVKVN